MAVLRASLSGKGYDITRGVMRLNRFLGDLVGGPAVLGEWAYTFCLFGSPSESSRGAGSFSATISVSIALSSAARWRSRRASSAPSRLMPIPGRSRARVCSRMRSAPA